LSGGGELFAAGDTRPFVGPALPRLVLREHHVAVWPEPDSSPNFQSLQLLKDHVHGVLCVLAVPTAFGSASLAFLRFTKGTTGAAIALSGSIIFWMLLPVVLATRRLTTRDL